MRLRDEVALKTGIQPRIRIGAPGSFDVIIDGQRVLTNRGTGRVPSSDEVLAVIRAHSG